MESSYIESILSFLGRLHPLVVHFPIGLLIVAFFLELYTLKSKKIDVRSSISIMVYVGSITSVFSVIFGLLLKKQEGYTGGLVELHQNLGIITAVLLTIVALVLYVTNNGKIKNLLWYRTSFFISIVLLSIVGHLGANLTHGENYLTSVFSETAKTKVNGEEATVLLAKLKEKDTFLIGDKDQLSVQVRSIFAHNCYQCHSENKQKGGLALDTKEGVFKGGESGEAVSIGNPDKSEIYKRIILSPNDKGVMPKKGKTLAKEEVALIKMWIEKGAHWSDKEIKVFPEAELTLKAPKLPESSSYVHPVDIIIDNYFNKNNISWPDLVEDHIFIRRAYLDVVGLLPKPEEVQSFVADTTKNKRERLVNHLLSDTKNYTEHWISFWNDLLRNDYSGPGFITGGRKQITNWLYTSLKTNKPYNQMVSELVNPNSESEGFIKGIQWRGVVNSSQRTEMQAAQNIGQSLLGINVKCASCHNSFVSNLTLEQTYGFATIFANTPLELNRCDKPIGKMATPQFLYPELGSVDAESIDKRLDLLSKVITKPENGRLYRTITNRIWGRLLGRGIIASVDEMDNTPWNADLLDYLASDFVSSGYNLKGLIKKIMTSKAYQLPVQKLQSNVSQQEKYVFKGPVLRRINAEQFSDAISTVIAPVYYAVAYSPEDASLLRQERIWKREILYGQDVLPNPGKRFFRKEFNLQEKQEKATVLISVDHNYKLYINNQQISEGTDWRKVDKLDVTPYLKQGNNVIAIEASNEGKIPNPAGVLFVMKMVFGNGSEQIIRADTSWKCTEKIQSKDWVLESYSDEDWEYVRNYGDSYWGNLINFSFEDNNNQFARASLVEQHSFMKALGRPTRENVTTLRDNQATLLQALELTNGAFFNQVLEDGAKLWTTKYGNDSDKIVTDLYQSLFARKPNRKEYQTMVKLLGDSPSENELKDLFWAVLLTPEFQFIY